MSPSEFGRWYRGMEQLSEEQAQMVARSAVRQIDNWHVRWATVTKMVTGMLPSGWFDEHPSELRSFRADLDLRLQAAASRSRQDA